MRRTLLPLSIGILLAGCSSDSSPQAFKMPPVPVQTASVEVRDVPLYFEAMGIVKPSCTSEIRPQVNGMIKEVHFAEGQLVEAGDVLYTIEETPYAVRVKEAEAQLIQDQTHLKSAKKKLERYKTLTKQDLIAQVEWDELESKIAMHKAMVMADQARLSAAKHDLEHCRITAPISGRAGKTILQAGNIAGGSPLVTITQKDPLYVDFSITEGELQKIGEQMPTIEVYYTGSEEPLASGQITFLDHTIDPKSGMLHATAMLTEEKKTIWPGQSVRVQVLFGKKEQASLVPMRAIKTNQQGPYIFAVKEDMTIEIRPVKLGAEEKGLVVVEEGLNGACKVVTEGHLRLFPGSQIEEVK